MGTLKQNIHWILLIAAVLLLVGCLNLPIGYYTFIRIVVCIIAILAIVDNKDNGFGWRNIILALIAVLFNPIIPVYLHSKITWVIIDLLCAGWFVWMSCKIKKNNKK